MSDTLSNKWIFLSHSNEDYDLVCKLRNLLEERGLRPIMFFLKCLEGEPNDVVLDLLKKEISARPRFILCESDNSRKSYWVQKEVEYIKSLNKPYEIAELKNEQSILRAVFTVAKRNRVLILSSNNSNYTLTRQNLEHAGFDASYDVYENMPLYEQMGGMDNDNFESLVRSKISNIYSKGYILLLLDSKYLLGDIRVLFTLRAACNVKSCANYLIPVLIEKGVELPPDVFEKVDMNYLDVSDLSGLEQAIAITEHIKKVDLRKNE